MGIGDESNPIRLNETPDVYVRVIESYVYIYIFRFVAEVTLEGADYESIRELLSSRMFSFG